MNNQNKETAILDEQQLELKDGIINDFTIILFKHNIVIGDANDILYATLKKIQKKPVRVSS